MCGGEISLCRCEGTTKKEREKMVKMSKDQIHESMITVIQKPNTCEVIQENKRNFDSEFVQMYVKQDATYQHVALE